MLGLGQIAKIVGELESRAVRIQPRQCKRVRHRNARCTLCVDNCPSGSIEFDESPQLNQDTCVGCGICATVCPTGAIEATDPTNAELVQRMEQAAKNDATVVFACPRIKGERPEGIVGVSCLGRVDLSVFVGALSRGIREISLVDGMCPGCPNAVGRKLAELASQEATAIAEALAVTVHIAFVPDLPTPSARQSRATADAFSRRAFFAQLVQGTKRTTAITVATVLDTNASATSTVRVRGELPTYLPAARRLLIDSLKLLPISGSAVTVLSQFAEFDVAPSCSGCQMCAFFCPTGALRKVDGNGRLGLSFVPAYCTNCGLCQEICYLNSARAEPRVDLANITSESTETTWLNPQKASFEEKMKRLMQQ